MWCGTNSNKFATCSKDSPEPFIITRDNFLLGHTTTVSEEHIICSSIVVVATSIQLVVDRIAPVFI